ncbi:MAG: phosphate-starvation-inducible PsiE family protein [Halopenitus sp.]
MDDDQAQGSDDPKAAARAVEFSGRLSLRIDQFVHAVELAAAALFALLFAVGVVDLMLKILEAVSSGRITDPLVVISFIDTGLLLLIIVEVYETVVAYTQESETRKIVRLVIYTGVIAMVRKAIIFRTGEYATSLDALYAAVAYTVIIFGLVGLLLVERAETEALLPGSWRVPGVRSVRI